MRPAYLPHSHYAPSPVMALYLRHRADGMPRVRAVLDALRLAWRDFNDPNGKRL